MPARRRRPQTVLQDRLAEIRGLKLKLNELRQELGLLRSSAANGDLLRREVASEWRRQRHGARGRARAAACGEGMEQGGHLQPACCPGS